ncbi:hypothetical protein GQ457_03G020650 [Hibiscus cannabinus]
MSSNRTILSLTTCYDLAFEQMDVKTAFLHGYKKTTSDHCVFVKRFSDDDFIILMLYVDDMLIVGRNTSIIDKLKQELSKSFVMEDLGPAKCVALSTTKSEFIAATKACKEMLWKKKFIHKFGFIQERYVMYCDSERAIQLGKNSTFHARSKHIDVSMLLDSWHGDIPHIVGEEICWVRVPLCG